jgi:hypothetical protein
MKITVKEGWSKQSKMAIVAMGISVLAIVAAVVFD